MRLTWLVVFHLFGPALFCYAIAYLLVYPEDWSGPAVVAPVSLLLTAGCQFVGRRWIRRTAPSPWRVALIAAQIAGPVGGVAIGVMLYFLMKG